MKQTIFNRLTISKWFSQINLRKNIIFFLIACLFCCVFLTGCRNRNKDNECTNHIDENIDGKCDVCGKDVPIVCTEHIDANHDDICDRCEEEVHIATHIDENIDGKCDVCGKDVPIVCTEHIDENHDNECDRCKEEVHIAIHIDENSDGFCDVCNAEVEIICIEHVDNDHDGICDVCKEDISDSEIPLSKIYELLADAVPSEIDDSITLPNTLRNCSAYISWQSSNQNVLNHRGIVKRDIVDWDITLTANITYSFDDKYSYEIKTKVKKIVLKPLENKKLVVAYLYASSGFSGINKESLEDIDYINYSFGSVVGGTAYVVDSQALQSILTYRNQGVRVGLALGGWGAGGFSEAVATAEARTIFADSIIEVIKKYNFDGIDIDWEYPTSSASGISSSPKDKENLTLFAKELSEKMKAYRSDLLFTMAVAANGCFEFDKLSEYVDYFNLMTYDYSIGSTSALHHASLYSSSYSASSVDVNVKRLISYGVPKNKIIIGAAFYGRWASFSSSSSMTLGSPLQKALTSTMSFTGIDEKVVAGLYTESWDEVAQAPYILKINSNKTGGFFITYDNEKSVGCKCDYIIDNELGGIMFWELTQDTTGKLVKVMGDKFNNPE